MARKKAQTGAPSGTEKDPGATPLAPGAPPVVTKEEAPAGETLPEATIAVPKVEPPELPAKGPKRLKISNPACAGLRIGGSTGTIVFNESGVAEVGVEDHAHFLKVPGYVSVE